MLNAIYCLLSVMSMTASFVILADMEQPFAGSARATRIAGAAATAPT